MKLAVLTEGLRQRSGKLNLRQGMLRQGNAMYELLYLYKNSSSQSVLSPSDGFIFNLL